MKTEVEFEGTHDPETYEGGNGSPDVGAGLNERVFI